MDSRSLRVGRFVDSQKKSKSLQVGVARGRAYHIMRIMEVHGHLQKHAPTDLPEQELIDKKTLAGVLNVSPSTVARLASRGELPPPIRVGPRLRRWCIDDVRAWIRRKCAC